MMDKRLTGENTSEGKGEGNQRRLGELSDFKVRSNPWGQEKGGMKVG